MTFHHLLHKQCEFLKLFLSLFLNADFRIELTKNIRFSIESLNEGYLFLNRNHNQYLSLTILISN